MPRQFKIQIDKQGYPVINGAGTAYTRRNGMVDRNALAMHRWIVLAELGIQSYTGLYHIHHCDGNRLDWRFDNLVMLTADSHRLVHAVVEAEGRWLSKSEILTSTQFVTDYLSFDVVFGDVADVIHPDVGL